MTPDRWRQVTEVFHAALAREASARAPYLDQTCGDDPELRKEVDAMLGAHGADAQFGETPVSVGTAQMPRLAAGALIGPYRIDGLIGSGGMGEVYRARDTRLGRDVAIKVLPAAFTSDADRLRRFEREARVLATLNHPHIGAIHSLEASDGMHALVLEFVEGSTLADRVAKGPVPVKEALDITRQIAEALEAAHEKGIVHRDLKPANIKVTADRAVKVLDFGLAKAWIGEGDHGDLSPLPTVTATALRDGLIMGTPAYMSPEQARGQVVDKRTDIWAFGCVLYEMLTGRAAFPGDTMSDTIAAILEREPDWTALPGSTPPKVRDLLQRCLRKDPRQRLHDIADARIEIDEALTTPPAETLPTASSTIVRPTSRWRRIAAFAVVALIAGSLASMAVWLATRPSLPAPRVSRFMITPSSEAALTLEVAPDRSLAITPDGSRVVYTGADGLFVRALEQLEATRLTGLGVPHGVFLSPDGLWIGFSDGQFALKKVALSGGPAVLLSPLDGTARGATWGSEETIVFATLNVTTGLQQIPAAGGKPTVLTRPNRVRGEADHLWPEFLPGGQAVLFTIIPTSGGLDAAAVAVLDLRTGAQTILLRGGSHAHYVQSGHLIYGAAGTLRAVPFDLAARAVVGPPVPVVSQVVTLFTGAVDAVVADNGTLVYVPGKYESGTGETLVWVDRQGREEPVKAPPRSYFYPRLAPDGTRLALSIFDQEYDIWLWDLARTTFTRVTSDPSIDNYPVWTPDSRRLLFSSERAGARSLFVQAADGTGSAERLTEATNRQNPTSISPDGAWLVFTETMPGTGQDVMTLPLSGERRVAALIQTPFEERNGEISPDGRWIAYEANDSGQFEIYVRPFPTVMDGRWQVSTGGGTRPLWARNGQELFYLAQPTGALMRVGVERDDSWAATAPVQLLEGRYATGSFESAVGRTYDVSLDGQRFLMIKPGVWTTAPTSLVVVQNWDQELKRLLPAN